MGFKEYLIFLSAIAISIHSSHGCEMDGITSWLLPQQLNILDVFRGEFFSRETTSITGINNIVFSDGLNRGPYLDVTQTNSVFTVSTNDAYVDYEEYETSQSISFTVTFNCVGGTVRSMVFLVDVTDTNNNDPVFMPNSEYEFTVIPPLSPGYQITGCWNDIISRDIDLTTQRVEFEIFDTPYFEIAYDAESSTESKEFKASLKTTTFIRSIPEPIVFTISATDVDLTNDPNRTTYATVRIRSDGLFDLPEEPVFSQTFYLATYTENQVTLQETISLSQGYHEDVDFVLDEEYSEYFVLVTNGNQITIDVRTPLPTELLTQQQLLLVVRAERNYTSGASATVVIQMPEEEALTFQQANYEGSIIDNVLQLSELVLAQGYEGNLVTVEIISEYASYFSYTVQLNTITLAMTPLPSTVIEQNNFLNLLLVASTNRSSVSTVVTLEIVKDDVVTPVFERALYEGAYDPDNTPVLTLDQIVLVQGYDETVQVDLQGDQAVLFQVVQDGSNINLSVVSSIPTELFRENNLLLTLEATKPRTVGATTVISIALPTETQLEFEAPNYVGVIEDNTLQLTPLILSQGYDSDPVNVQIESAYASYFTSVTQQNTITISMSPLPANIIELNTIIILQLVASTERSSATTIVTLEIIKDDNITPVFQRTLYEGSYDPLYGLTLEEIVLVQGYDESVQLTLQGEHAAYFETDQNGPYINLTVSSLPETLFSEHTLLLSIEASKPRTVGANAAISITLPADRELRFNAETYSGTIKNSTLTLENIVMDVGFTADVEFALTGDYASYFEVVNVDNQISVELREQIPETVILQNNFLLLTLSASALNAVTTSSTILLEIVKEDTTTPRFSQDIYFGNYLTPSSIDIDPFYLTQGYDDTVSFRLDGVFSQYFEITYTGNSVALSLQSTIPEQLIFDEKVLTFSILADKELTVGAVAAVSISFPNELTEPTALRFSKNLYVGSLEQNSLTLENILLEYGFSESTEFALSGEYSSYFTMTPVNNIVSITAGNTISEEILNQKFISLELVAEGVRAVPVTTVIVIDIVQPETVAPPIFAEAYYRGVYAEETGLLFEEIISLSEGFDNTVTFELEGELSQWFAVSQNNNLATITNTSRLPEEVLENHNNLLFTIVARKPKATDGRAAISIDLPKEVTLPLVISFAQSSYVGQISADSLDLPPVILTEGYDVAIQLDLVGEFQSYFTLARESNTITVNLNTALPSEVINENAFILLDIEAAYPQAVSGYTTLVLELIKETDSQVITPVFEQAYYIGEYLSEGGLQFGHAIQLIQGFDESVSFTLSGDDSQGFTLLRIGENNYTVTLNENVELLPNDNLQLVFSVVATKPNSFPGSAAIIITLIPEVTSDQVLAFDRISYVGSFENDTVNLDPIVLSEGYTANVIFTLQGDLATYFSIDDQGATVNIELQSSIPEELIPSNRIILLEIQASAPQTVSTFATIVLEVILPDDLTPTLPQPVFGEAFYTGSYTETGGLVFDLPITLSDGYHETIEFNLEGEQSQWFTFDQLENSVVLVLANTIPPAVVANNQQLLFVITAYRPGGATARATVVIFMPDEISSDQILGFDRTSYVGSFENGTVTLDPIVLSEGFTTDVTFTLLGDLSNYFKIDPQGTSVNVELESSIPEESIPLNRIISLEIRASAPQAISTFAVIILEVILLEDPLPILTEPVFAETFYTGSYTETDGLVFDLPITLSDGYHETIEFNLEGEQSQWFSFTQSENSVVLVLANTIPPAVVANNQQLIFVITAYRPGGATARSTIVIALPDEISSEQIIGFDRISYIGSVENETVSLNSIVLSEGFTSDVTFTLHGDLAEFFRAEVQGATVIVELQGSIPQESIPSNRIILLEIRASAPQSISAFATIVLEVIMHEDLLPIVPDPVFAEAFYTGSYTETSGLVFNTLISLSDGYHETIEFSLDGEQSQWFTFTQSGNSVVLVLASTIPPAVVANNQQLIFVITANRPGSTTARATIVILLPDEVTSDQILGFDRTSYVGSFGNDTINLDQIVLSEGFTTNVIFTLHGDLAFYFRVDEQDAIVNVVLLSSIPEDFIPSNRIILLEIRATAPQAITAFATIVLEVIIDDDHSLTLPEPVFAETFYTGSYMETSGLAFDTPITLTDGYHETIEFNLEGEQSQWFAIFQSGNSVVLELSSTIPPAIVASNQQLIFVITAYRPEGATARATIVIILRDEVTLDHILGFDRTSYVGTLANHTVVLDPIVLSVGFTTGVTFLLHGDLAGHFIIYQQGAIVFIVAQESLTEELIPTNGIISLEIRASAPQVISAFAVIVLEVISSDDLSPALPVPVFAEAFYTGSYTETNGLTFDIPITLTDGYHETIEFNLEGEQSQWFAIFQSGNSVVLELSSTIPPAIVASNQQLIFVITAYRPEGATARATIIIILRDEVTLDHILGFDRTSYVGTLANHTVVLDPIVLSVGFTTGVTFLLHGDLAGHFIIYQQGAIVFIVAQESLTEELIPTNGIISLEIRASAPQVISAFAVIVLEVISSDDLSPALPVPVFAEAFYTGSYTETNGLTFDIPITLTDGYHETIEFNLEGEQSQWFAIFQSGNSVVLELSSTIPPAIVASNQQLIFVITAYRPEGAIARATIIIILRDEVTLDHILGFDRTSYVGTLANHTVVLDPIVLSVGFTTGVTFLLHGDLAGHFIIYQQGAIVFIVAQESLTEELIPTNGIISLEIRASAPQVISAFAVIVLEVISSDDLSPALPVPVFAEAFYTGSYTETNGLTFDIPITLTDGYHETIEFNLEGEQSQWFAISQSGNSVVLELSSTIPPAIAASNQQLIFVITAYRPEGETARATIVILLPDEVSSDHILGFDRTSYVGTFVNDTVVLDPIVLSVGFTTDVTFSLQGDLADFFIIDQQGATVNINVQNSIPGESIPLNGIISLEVRASAPQAISAVAVIVLEVILPDDLPSTLPEPDFAEAFYTGSYTEIGGLMFDTQITLSEGYHETIEFDLDGEESQWFGLTQSDNSVVIVLTSTIPPAIVANNQQLIFVITAHRPGGMTARATIVILLPDEVSSDYVLGFDRTNYVGFIENETVNLDLIVLSEGFSPEVTFSLHGDLSTYFGIDPQDATVSVQLQSSIPQEFIPSNRIILLEIRASAPQALSVFATIVLEVILPDDLSPETIPEPVFAEVFYTGIYTITGDLIFDTPISLADGYDNSVVFSLDGEHTQYFVLYQSGNSVNLIVSSPIPTSVIIENQKLVFVINAQRPNSGIARATIIIVLEQDSYNDSLVAFDKVLYEGIVQNNVVQHEAIRISGFEDDSISIIGVYASFFSGSVINGVVTIQTVEPLTLPAEERHIILELRAANSGAVLVLEVTDSDGAELPTVLFDSASYVLRVELGQTGLVGRVYASADNGEAVTYSLLVDNEHLRSRISINSDGEINLFAPANSGVYNFQAVATTVFTEATGLATVYLSVEALTVCGDDTVTAPLIVVDRDEEEPHRDLVLLNATEHAGCQFTLTNKWPADQNWLYVDETGLHTTAIDREDPSIAFMALSQVQVELTLICDSDVTRTKRSVDDRLDWLGPYDYGTNTWLLGETILYNPRRSIVNLIVNDINDNAPIFVGKEDEPIIVGYPVAELEDTILPRSLAELQATDADIGENAALVYWSSEPELAVSPTTGFVHVRDTSLLEQDMVLTVNATDLNGQGHTGSITLMVKLLTSNYIGVITVRDAFLEDESRILGNISNVIGYEVRSLRSVVVAQVEEAQRSRHKRDVTNEGASLEIYAYGLVQREPVAVETLANDINNAAVVTVNIASIQSLEDHLESLLICDNTGRDTGLLVSTIVLSILLFILIVAIIVWYVLKRIKKRNYEQFSDENSLASQSESPPKPLDFPVTTKPRLNIEELKRSERRLQDMLNTPVENVNDEPSSSKDNTINSVTKIPDPIAPIVIQDKLKDAASDIGESDDDEFGERKKPRRKSVVTFNENVEKIIHLDETPDIIADPDYEVYKL